MYRYWLVLQTLYLTAIASGATAQVPRTPSGSPGSTISGIVTDSLARLPLRGALVQLVASDGAARYSRSATTDSSGRFALLSVPNGRFTLGFLHPILDSLGLEPPLREVVVENAPLRVDLATPSPARLRNAICGSPNDSSHPGVLLGVLRDPRSGGPVAGAIVMSEWLEVSLGRGGVSGTVPQVVDTTRDNGWFAVCNIPSPGTMAVVARLGSDSTDRIEVDVPTEGFVHRSFYLGAAIRDSGAFQRTGTGVVRGIVFSSQGRPLEGAYVGVVDGPFTQTNARGEWTIRNAPTGTRQLQVRAVGFYPDRHAVDVIEGGPPDLTTLSTMKAVLDTVRITTSRLTRQARGFEERRRTGLGRYITQEDVVRRQPIVTSDLFRSIGGIRIERSANPAEGTSLLMRGTFEESCSPAVFLDGVYMSQLNAEEIDTWVRPNEIAGIEIYAGTYMPAQFARGLAGVGRNGSACGSVVIWTTPSPIRRQTSWLQRLGTVLIISGLALGVAVLVDR